MAADQGRFHGHRGGECGQHRTVGHHRAWCFDCHEWCSPRQPCASCERPMLEARAHTLEVALRRLLEFVDPQCLCHGQGMCAVCRARAALEGDSHGG